MSETIEKKVRLIAIDSKYHTSPVFAAPKYNEITKEFSINGKIYKGKKSDNTENSPVISEEAPVRLTDQDSYRLAHLMEFKIGDPVDEFLLDVALESGYVAKSKAEVNPGTIHRFYLEDKEQEATSLITKAELSFAAMTQIKAMSLEDMENCARLIGGLMKNMSKKQIEAYLMKEATEHPQRVLDSLEDKNKKQRIFLNKLLDNKIVEIRSGKYYHGKELIGVNEDFAIEFIKDSRNSTLITQWHQQMKGKSE